MLATSSISAELTLHTSVACFKRGIHSSTSDFCEKRLCLLQPLIAEMRLVYITCVLLATTITCIATNDASTTQGDNKPSKQETATVAASAVSLEKPTIPANKVNVIATDTKPASNTTDTINTDVPTTVTTANVTNGHPTKPSTSAITKTTPIPSTTTTTPIPSTTTPIPSTTTPIPTTTTTTAKTTTSTHNITTTPSAPETTATPVSTKVAPPYKERHFDGLSFLGGIILATCLVAIGAFSWKFYRTFNERHYRTL